MNKINWYNYIDHIFCINYLPNNRYDSFSKKLSEIDIDINNIPSSKLTFIYDHDLNLLNSRLSNNINMNNLLNDINKLIINDFDYKYNYTKTTLKLSLNTYHILNIAKHFNYDRILYIEDDPVFLKDKNYLINALNRINTLDFDIFLGQGCYCFNENMFNEDNTINGYYKDNILYEDEYFYKINEDVLSSYGSSICIITKSGINKLLQLDEYLNYPIAVESMFGIKNNNNIKFNILTVKKPFAVQDYYLDVEDYKLKQLNPFININEYK